MKTVLNIFIIIVCLIFGVTFAYAGSGKSFSQNNNSANSAKVKITNFVDKDGDGACDNLRKNGKGGGKGKGNGKGKRYRRGARDGNGPHNTPNNRGPNFVDKNGDGICDNIVENTNKK